MDFQRTSENSPPAGRARVVAPVATPGDLAEWQRLLGEPGALERTCDVIEIRADAFPEAGMGALEAAARACPLPILLTVRRPDEGGGNGALDAGARGSIFRRLMPLAALVDIEVRSLDELSGTVADARSGGRPVIASAHDFLGVPDDESLRGAVATAQAHGASVVKIAATPGSFADLLRLAGLLAAPSPLPMAVMGMGSFGRVSRLLCAAGGSVLNYGYLSAPNAPGQWPAAELKALVARLAG